MALLPSPTHALLIACEDYLTELKLHDEPKSKLNRTSHERPLVAVVYNEKKRQVNAVDNLSVARFRSTQRCSVYQFVFHLKS